MYRLYCFKIPEDIFQFQRKRKRREREKEERDCDLLSKLINKEEVHMFMELSVQETEKECMMIVFYCINMVYKCGGNVVNDVILPLSILICLSFMMLCRKFEQFQLEL